MCHPVVSFQSASATCFIHERCALTKSAPKKEAWSGNDDRCTASMARNAMSHVTPTPNTPTTTTVVYSSGALAVRNFHQACAASLGERAASEELSPGVQHVTI